VNKRLGIRGDLRMIRIFDVHNINEQADDNLHISHITLWRVSVGATLRF